MATMKALGCHIYAGGFTLGVQKHFDVLAHFEDGTFGTKTVERNLGIPIYQKKDGWPGPDVLGSVDFIYCNPPCAPWSVASSGRSTGWHQDSRTQCAKDCVEQIHRFEPTVYAHESVRGLYTKGRSMLMQICEEMYPLGYSPYFVLTDAAEHGVAQRRLRVFLVLSKVRIDWRPTGSPERTAGEILDKGPFRDNDCRAMAKAKWSEIIDKVEPGELVVKVFAREFPETIGVPNVGRGNFFHRRLDPDATAPIFCHETIHPTENRFLTVGETQALTGYPDDYEFVGATGVKYQHISKAVLPPVGEYVAREVARAIKTGKPFTQKGYTPVEVKVYRDKIETQCV